MLNPPRKTFGRFQATIHISNKQDLNDSGMISILNDIQREV